VEYQEYRSLCSWETFDELVVKCLIIRWAECSCSIRRWRLDKSVPPWGPLQIKWFSWVWNWHWKSRLLIDTHKPWCGWQNNESVYAPWDFLLQCKTWLLDSDTILTSGCEDTLCSSLNIAANRPDAKQRQRRCTAVAGYLLENSKERTYPYTFCTTRGEMIWAWQVGLSDTQTENRWGSAVVNWCCEKPLTEARRQIASPREGECPSSEAATKHRLFGLQ
jgi:hypothetical protein